MDHGSEEDAFPTVTLRRLDGARARAIVDRVPCEGDEWVVGYPAEGDVEAALMALRTLAKNATSPFVCYEVLDDAGRTVGGAGFHGPPRFDGVVEIGYGIANSVRNRGFARSAIRTLTTIAADNGATKVTARTDPKNYPSQRALQRAGFVFDHPGKKFVFLVFECAPARQEGALPR